MSLPSRALSATLGTLTKIFDGAICIEANGFKPSSKFAKAPS